MRSVSDNDTELSLNELEGVSGGVEGGYTDIPPMLAARIKEIVAGQKRGGSDKESVKQYVLSYCFEMGIMRGTSVSAKKLGALVDEIYDTV